MPATSFSESRLLWKCRRGTRELDMILQGFVKHHFHALPEQEQVRFLGLLDSEDTLLIHWLCMGGTPDCPETAHIVDLIVSATSRSG